MKESMLMCNLFIYCQAAVTSDLQPVDSKVLGGEV